MRLFSRLPWLLLFTLIAFATCPYARAQEIQRHWQFAGWYGGGCYPDVIFDPRNQNRVYAVSDVAGIWRSDDLGERWNFITDGLENLIVATLALAPSDSNVLYAGTQAGLFRSKNAGQRWEACAAPEALRFKRPENHRVLAVSALDPARLAVGGATGVVFYSENAGDRWRNLGSPFSDGRPVTAMQWPGGGEFLYAASFKGLAKYSFTGGRWEILAAAPEQVTDLIVFESEGTTLVAAAQKWVYISKDGGISWGKTETMPRGNAYRVALPFPKNTLKMMVACNDGWKGETALTEDGGKTWKRGDTKLFSDRVSNPTRQWAGSHGRINALEASPFNPQVFLRSDWWGLWRSDDGGRTWHEKIKGAPNTVGSDILVGENGEIFVACMDDGLLKSVDGGLSYAPVFPLKGYDKTINGHAWRLASLGDGNVLATASPWDDRVNQAVICDVKSGAFQIARKGLPEKRPVKNTVWGEGYARALAVAGEGEARVIYLGLDGDDGGGLYVSRDGGQSWRFSEGQPPSKKIYNALAVDSSRSPHRLVWGSSEKSKGGVFVSEDAGLHWKRALRMHEVFDAAIAADGRIYAAGADHHGPAVYSSSDGGKKWILSKRFSSGDAAEALCLFAGAPQRVAVSTLGWHGKAGGRIHLSENGGKSWTDVTGDLPYGEGAAAMAYNAKDGHLYVLRQAGSVYKTKISE